MMVFFGLISLMLGKKQQKSRALSIPIPSQSTGWLIGIPGSISVTNNKPGRLRTFISKPINNPLTIVVLNHIPIFRG
jgi:hypothetical protein